MDALMIRMTAGNIDRIVEDVAAERKKDYNTALKLVELAFIEWAVDYAGLQAGTAAPKQKQEENPVNNAQRHFISSN